MKKLENNLTFAIIIKDVAWRTDLTVRFCEYFSKKINGSDFMSRVIFPDNIDSAIAQCNTDYLLIQSSGHITYDISFFKFLDEIAEQNKDISVGHIELAEDYAIYHHRCLFVNIPLWQEAGKPLFNSKVREGDMFTPGEFQLDNKKPYELTAVVGERIYIPHEAAEQGADFIASQLKMFGTAKSFAKLISSESHYLDDSTAYSEIHSETIFEKKFLKLALSNVYTATPDVVSQIESQSVSVVVTPAQGLKANIYADHFKPELIVIYDISPIALEFQKFIFATTKPTLFSEIITQFKTLYPYANFVDEVETDKDVVVYPSKNTKIRYELVDAFSFEMENLIQSFDSRKSAVFDISDIFTHPFNYYKRPLFQVEGLFIELFSLMKSRAGATYIVGDAPGFKTLNDIEINTSVAQYEADPSVDPYAYDEETEEAPTVEPIMYAPQPVAPRLEDENLSKKWFTSLKKTFKIPQRQIVEVIKEVIVEKIVEKEVIVEKIVEKERLVPTTQITMPVILQPEEIGTTMTPIEYALSQGYEQSSNNELVNREFKDLLVLSKVETFTELEAIFEYRIDVTTKAWSFKVGKVGHEKRIEFSSGQTFDGLLKHLKQELKINPKAAAKYF